MAQLNLTVAGRASKRGLIPRQPPADRLIAGIETWLRLEYPDVVRSTRTRTSATGDRELLVGLHPAAEELSIAASDEGDVVVSAELAPVGPGYQTFVGRLIERIGIEHEITWQAPTGEGGHGAGDIAAVDDRPRAEQAYLTWLGAGLIGAREQRRRAIGGVHVGTPADVRFTFDGAIATSLGPRDDAWLDAALADSRLALDITPWWADATDARCFLNRALCLMWTDVRWRQPVDDGERLVQEEVIRLLSRAFPLDPSLPYPWREWKELAHLHGVEDAMTRQVKTRAKTSSGPLIGYRRDPVRIVHEGWELEVPGSFGERRTGDEWFGSEAGRSITLAATETGTSTGPMSADDFLLQVSPDLGKDALAHRAGEVVGRARLSTDTSSGVEVGVLEGFSAVRGRGAAIRIVFDDSADWQWALEMWRALSPAGRGSYAAA